MRDTPPVSLGPLVPDDDVDNNLPGVRSEIVTQVQSFLASFAKSLGGRFSKIDERFSQVMPSSSSEVTNERIDVNQDVINRSLAAPSPVAVRTEHPPDKAPFALYSDGLGLIVGGPATASAPLGDPSLPNMSFSELLTTVWFFETSGSGVPDSFLDSFHFFVVYSIEFGFAIG